MKSTYKRMHTLKMQYTFLAKKIINSTKKWIFSAKNEYCIFNCAFVYWSILFFFVFKMRGVISWETRKNFFLNRFNNEPCGALLFDFLWFSLQNSIKWDLEQRIKFLIFVLHKNGQEQNSLRFMSTSQLYKNWTRKR